jgi:signal transduction histidine kinase
MGDQLWHASAESLPPEYLADIDGFRIGPGVGSCGHAAYTGQLTITADIATHPNWADYRDLVLPYGLRSAWSMPIRAPDNEIIGAFEIYTRTPATPTAEHLRLIEVASHLAGLAIAQEQNKRTLEERALALADADRRKDAFLATLAHELRNPLAAIMTAVELMQLAGTNAALQARAREVVGRQVRQLVHLVDDLLDVSRITQGKIRLNRSRCDVREFVQGALESVQPTIDTRRQQVTVEGPEASLEVDGDCIRLVQVMTNLIANAAKYTAPGGAIDIDWSLAGNDVLIEVRDSGEGIRPELLPHVFDLFVQADRTLEKAGGGLGIGLTLVRTIVELHGGRVAASSPGPNQGSVFTVQLPAACPNADQSAASTVGEVASTMPP